tara:strand:+ start:49 stop:360 length:312 start_codon:yes stop_codon:yes gene_type:complete
MSKYEIKVVRLKTGEDVLCEYQEINNESYIKNGLVLVPMQGDNNEAQLGFYPFVPYAKLKDDTLKVGKHNVLWYTDPQDDLSEKYRASFSKIITPSSAGLIGG